MVIAFSDTARVLSSYTQNLQEIRRAIEGIEQTNGTTDPHEALTIASGLANPQRAGEEDAAAIPATVYLLSDGNFPDIADISLGNLTLNFLSVGKEGENVAVVSLGGRRNDDAPDRYQVLANVKNFGKETSKTAVELLVDGVSKDLQSIELAPGETQGVMFRLAAVDSAAIGVRLDHMDELALDNAAWTVVNPPRPIRLLIVGPENAALDAALATPALSTIAKIERQPSEFAQKDFADETQVGVHDLVIFDRCAPTSMPNSNTLFLGSLPPTLPKAEKTEIENPILLNWKSTHPLLRFLVLDDVTILRAFTVPLPSGADRLMECDKGTVLFSMPRGIFTDVVQTFPIVGEDGNWQTDWPLKLSFPLYVMNLVRVLGGAEGEARSTFRPGEIVNIRANENERSATIVNPDGRSTQLQSSPQGTFSYVDTEALGVYQVTIGERTQRFAVNLCDEQESSIRPSEKVSVGSVQVADVSGKFQTRRELWRWLAVLAFFILVFEWYVYNRRVYI
ncbi:MAG: VWA domain-containing protein [Planctomycetota bacterium]